MKKYRLLLSFALFIGTLLSAQIPTGYYDGTAGLTGYALKTKLSQIITLGHNDKGYGGLWTCYKTSDIDNYYEKDASILDMYSEKPGAKDAYEFQPGAGQCGVASQKNVEGSCYNREHSLPKTYFGGIDATPMSHDAHFVVPTDYYVNNKRDNYLYGETSNPTITFTNGSKIGPSSVPGFSGTVFEPIDEFKGDFARMWLYFITRYETKLPSFYNLNISGTPFDGSTGRGFQPWLITMLLKWCAQDPVSQRETDRNNAVYAFQGNRNPYIDHPEWVQQIWGSSTLSTLEAQDSQNFRIYPNPVRNSEIFITGKSLEQINSVKIYSADGQLVQAVDNPLKDGGRIHLYNLAKGIYILRAGKQSAKFVVE